MITKNDRFVFNIDINSQPVSRVYKGAQLIWLSVYNAIRSCFGSGTWYGDKPWLGTDDWTTNN